METSAEFLGMLVTAIIFGSLASIPLILGRIRFAGDHQNVVATVWKDFYYDPLVELPVSRKSISLGFLGPGYLFEITVSLILGVFPLLYYQYDLVIKYFIIDGNPFSLSRLLYIEFTFPLIFLALWLLPTFYIDQYVKNRLFKDKRQS
jgi:hypothetical protein